MKMTLVQVGVLTAVVALVLVTGEPLARDWWGPRAGGVLRASAAMCYGGALAAVLFFAVGGALWPQHRPMVALGMAPVRLLATGAAILVYQSLTAPPMTPFIAALAALYLPLLVAETALIVYMVRREFAARPVKPE